MSRNPVQRSLSDLVGAAGLGMAAGRSVIGGPAEVQPRLALFHAAASVCSQKVRAVLAHHGLAYASHPVNLFAGETYWPDYIRLRMIGCRALGMPLASLHTGSTAASSGGCDGIVVPTLVDLEQGEVIVDSRAICLWLDAQVPPERRLQPAALAEAIARELAIVDDMPNYQLLMSRRASAAAPAPDLAAMANFSLRKVGWCDDLIARFPDDEAIVAACTAKRAKEQSAADLLFAPAALARAHDQVAEALDHLESRLAQDGPLLFQVAPTLADLVWGVELLRIENVGQAHFWAGGRLPRVARYLAALRALPALRAAVIDWPGAIF